MRANTAQKLIFDILTDAKGQEIHILDVRKVTDFTDFMVIVTGTSTRHVISMADRVREGMRDHGRVVLGTEGEDVGDWVLVDFGDVVVHVMRQQVRDFYNLEKLWGDGERADVAGH
ncbi:MAG: ribosome silencing factor [Acidiferrobacterales bacterium]